MNNNLNSPSLKQRILHALHLLISHHDPPFMNRCWHITFRGHTLHICARCSALLVGIILTLYLNSFIFRIPVNPLTFFFAFLLSLPAVIDWSSQTLQMRESRNLTRSFTGFLLGNAVGFVVSSLNIIYMILVVVLYSGYTLIFGALAPKIIRWRFKRQSNNKIPRLLSQSSTPQTETTIERDEEEIL
ncbi:MAG: DUF2085 domain-containing protein [Candidatus Thorarchaeota archaeon]